jgi:hypothetical protein
LLKSLGQQIHLNDKLQHQLEQLLRHVVPPADLRGLSHDHAFAESGLAGQLFRPDRPALLVDHDLAALRADETPL